jgi:hypothetical protein
MIGGLGVLDDSFFRQLLDHAGTLLPERVAEDAANLEAPRLSALGVPMPLSRLSFPSGPRTCAGWPVARPTARQRSSTRSWS